MRAADTNVLVRLLMRDDARPTYGLKPGQIRITVEMLLKHQHITVQDADVLEVALAMFRSSSTDFSDCLVLATARKAGHLPLGTFDRRLARLEGATLVR